MLIASIRVRVTQLLVVAFVVGVFALPSAQAEVEEAQTTTRPNMILILTDDQRRGDYGHMPNLQEGLVENGTTFSRYVATYPWCCPSRSAILRGQYSHNTGIISNSLPAGGAKAFRRDVLDRSTVATWLDDAGYKTGLIGKYLNEYEGGYVPPGWDRWFGQVRHNYPDARFYSQNRMVTYEGRHTDALIAEKTLAFVTNAEEPFFAWVGFNAPHEPMDYPDRDRGLFRDEPLPKPPSFNEADVTDKPSYIRNTSRLSKDQIAKMTADHRARLRSLQTVDRFVASVVDLLDEQGELENTYLFYLSDNGYHLGEHRMVRGKQTPYVEDFSFPLIVRGPSVPSGATDFSLVGNHDLAPTFASLAETSAPDFVDGSSMTPLLDGPDAEAFRERILIEGEGFYPTDAPPFSAVYERDGSLYTAYASSEREFYDLDEDPYQLVNAEASLTDEQRTAFEQTVLSLSVCEAASCRVAEDAR
jgi:arylsulfatase A-like enzyme